MENCARRFIRRGYLLIHLQKVHSVDADTARKHAYNLSSDCVVDKCVSKKDCRQDAAANYPDVEVVSDAESGVSDATIQQLRNPVHIMLNNIERDTNNNSEPTIEHFLEELCKGGGVVIKDTKIVSETVSSVHYYVDENCGLDVECVEQGDIRRVVFSKAVHSDKVSSNSQDGDIVDNLSVNLVGVTCPTRSMYTAGRMLQTVIFLTICHVNLMDVMCSMKPMYTVRRIQ